MSVSVLILTFNEEQNISRCMDSVKWSDDVLVVDSYSTDKTVDISRKFGARVVQNKFVNFATQRNFGISQTFKHDWILHLDADEVVTEELHREILEACQHNEKDAYQVSSKMMFHGRWLRHSSLFPWYQVRLGHRDRLKFVQVGHGQRESLPAERIGTLKESLIHYSFSKGISDWLDKHNRYATLEADQYFRDISSDVPLSFKEFTKGDAAHRKRALKRLFSRLPCRPFLRFIYMYIYRMGFLDGRPGLTFCTLLSIYEYFIVLKIKERRLQDRGIPL